MIFKSLELIRRNLEDYIQSIDTDEEVTLDNVALFESIREETPPPGTNKPNIIISLVNVEEEASLKNNPHYRTKKINGEVDYHNPPQFINLYMLVTANHSNYMEALQKLSLIMQFFQSKKIFTVPSAFNPARAQSTAELELDFTDEEAQELKLNIELFSMTFEQVNHLWGSLGGKQIPFALYVVRLVRIEDRAKRKGGGLIQEIHINEE